MQEGKRKRQGSTFHICHRCKKVKGFWGKQNARFCSDGCRSGNAKDKAKKMVQVLFRFFQTLDFSLDDLLDYRDRCFKKLLRVCELMGYVWNEWDREWERVISNN